MFLYIILQLLILLRMDLYYKPFLLEFKHPFGISSNTRKETPTVFIKLEAGEYCGYGEACLPAYLGETTKDTISFFEKAKPVLKKTSAPYNVPSILAHMDLLSDGNNAGKAAIDIALHDLAAKMAGKSYKDLMGFRKEQ